MTAILPELLRQQPDLCRPYGIPHSGKLTMLY